MNDVDEPSDSSEMNDVGAIGSTESSAHRLLRVSLVAGSLYDTLFAFVNLIVPEWGARLLSIPLPAEQLYLRFTGVFLVMLALFYLLPVIHPGRYLGNVVVAILGRAAGGAFLVIAATMFAYPPAFLVLGAGDLVFALLHAYFLGKAERGNPLRHYLS